MPRYRIPDGDGAFFMVAGDATCTLLTDAPFFVLVPHGVRN
jgi:hypothetical protein